MRAGAVAAGYGRTPLITGTTPAGFADAVAELCAHLGIGRVAAVVGISAGGRTAMTMAARHPELVERLVLESSVSFLPWPDRRTRVLAGIVFAPRTEALTWGAVRLLLRRSAPIVLRSLLGSLSTEPSGKVVAALSEQHRAELVALFSQMCSGAGFLNDLVEAPDVTEQITQPALIIASRKDGAVSFAHARTLADGIACARLIESNSDSHFIWFGPDYPAISATIRGFLASEPGDP